MTSITDPVAVTTSLSGVALTLLVQAEGLVKIERSDTATDIIEIGFTGLSGTLVSVAWTWPLGSAVNFWRSHQSHHRGLAADWQQQIAVEPMLSAPVGQLIGDDDLARLTVALSSNVDDVAFTAGIHEETSEFSIRLDLRMPDDSLGFVLRIDGRNVPFAHALQEVSEWWTAQLGHELLPVPELAFEPTYCTWYADHQTITAASVEARARQAAGGGFGAIIVDGGWHTADEGRTYAFCGDWRPDASKFADFPSHVDRVRRDAAYLLWFALPLIGKETDAWPRFEDMLLGWVDALDAAVLDPRFPEVRRHVTALCLRAVDEWGVDGLKLDFLDSFAGFDAPVRDGMDEPTVGIAVERMLAEIARALTAAKPNAIIEFRQNYTGPRMWRYANILRAGDCPMDAVENRVRTVDLRLLAGGRAVHSDPLVWHPDAESSTVAKQLINVVFSTPQVSVPLDRLRANQMAVLDFWLKIMREHRDLLQRGRLRPTRPDLRYPAVSSSRGTEQFIAVYADSTAEFDPSADRAFIANASPRSTVLLRTTTDVTTEAFEPDGGGPSASQRLAAAAADGVVVVPIPVGGLARLSRVGDDTA